MRHHDYKIHMSTVRAKLAPRTEPYWRVLGRGQAIGYRKRTPSDPGSFVGRWTDDKLQEGGGRRKTVQKYFQAKDYESAEAEARTWFTSCKGGVVKAGTVQAACEEYVANQRNEKGDRPASFSNGRFKLHVYGKPLGHIALDKLTTRDLERWRDSLVTPERKKNSVNRDLRSLKAALNFAFQRGMVMSDASWRRVKPFKGAADGQRTAYLSPKQRRDLLDKADADTANFVKGLLYSAARPNELAACLVSDFDERQKSLRLVSLKGSGSERVRYVPLTPPGLAFFKEMAKSKFPKAPLLTFQGHRWARHLWAEGIRKAAPGTVAYTMRHCAITDMLSAGVDVSSVSKIAGTSIGMINSHYAKFVQSDVRAKLEEIKAF